MPFDLKAFLKDFNVTQEEEGAILAVLDKPERVAVLEKSVLRQADYSKHMNDLSKAQADLKTANDRLNTEMAAWAEEQANGGVITQQTRDRAEKAEQRVLALQQRITRIATDAGLDPAKALEGIDQASPPKKDDPVPNVDLTGYVKAADLAGLAQMTLTLPAELAAIANEHFDLTGERLDVRTVVAEIQARAGTKGNQKPLDPRAIWEEQHQISGKREAKAQAARAAEIAAAEQRGYERSRTEQALPIAPSHGERSPLLRSLDGQKQHESVLKRPQPESGVRSAAAALATGKYRNQGALSKTA